jgi:hypothetical protein
LLVTWLKVSILLFSLHFTKVAQEISLSGRVLNEATIIDSVRRVQSIVTKDVLETQLYQSLAQYLSHTEEWWKLAAGYDDTLDLLRGLALTGNTVKPMNIMATRREG